MKIKSCRMIFYKIGKIAITGSNSKDCARKAAKKFLKNNKNYGILEFIERVPAPNEANHRKYKGSCFSYLYVFGISSEMHNAS